jgi:hypothetical protein
MSTSNAQVADDCGDVAALQAIAAAGTAVSRSRLEGDFLAAHRRQFERNAASLCRRSSLEVARHVDDVLQLLYEVATEVIRKAADDPSVLEAIASTSFDTYVFYQARPRVHSYAYSGQSGRPSRSIGLARRQHELNRSRLALRAELGREPTDEEVVAATNDRMLRTRKDAAHQGMLCTLDDIRRPLTVTGLSDDDHDLPTTSNDPDMARHEAVALMRMVLDRLADDPRLTAVATAWFGGVFDPDYGAPRELADIARMTGLTRAKAADAIARIREVSAQVLVERLGIGPDGAR